MTAHVFRPASAITFASVEQERSRFLAYCRERQDDLITVDLETIEQCDSAGLALLIEVKRIAKVAGRSSQIINMPQETRALAEFYGISDLLGICTKFEK